MTVPPRRWPPPPPASAGSPSKNVRIIHDHERQVEGQVDHDEPDHGVDQAQSTDRSRKNGIANGDGGAISRRSAPRGRDRGSARSSPATARAAGTPREHGRRKVVNTLTTRLFTNDRANSFRRRPRSCASVGTKTRVGGTRIASTSVLRAPTSAPAIARETRSPRAAASMPRRSARTEAAAAITLAPLTRHRRALPPSSRSGSSRERWRRAPPR